MYISENMETVDQGYRVSHTVFNFYKGFASFPHGLCVVRRERFEKSCLESRHLHIFPVAPLKVGVNLQVIELELDCN